MDLHAAEPAPPVIPPAANGQSVVLSEDAETAKSRPMNAGKRSLVPFSFIATLVKVLKPRGKTRCPRRPGQKEWPYAWADAPGYEHSGQRGSVTGGLVIRDPQAPSASAARAWVGSRRRPMRPPLRSAGRSPLTGRLTANTTSIGTARRGRTIHDPRRAARRLHALRLYRRRPVRLPPLRTRREDAMNLAWTFVIALAATLLGPMEAGAAEIAVDLRPQCRNTSASIPSRPTPSAPSTPVSMPTGFPMGLSWAPVEIGLRLWSHADRSTSQAARERRDSVNARDERHDRNYKAAFCFQGRCGHPHYGHQAGMFDQRQANFFVSNRGLARAFAYIDITRAEAGRRCTIENPWPGKACKIELTTAARGPSL